MYSIPGQQVSNSQKLYGQQHSFQVLSTFLYDIYVGHWPANTIWQQAKASDFIDNMSLYIYIYIYIYIYVCVIIICPNSDLK